jgi:magnesium transporter
VTSSPTPDHLDRPIAQHVRRDAVSLRSDHTVAEAFSSLRGRELGERVVYFYVVDDSERLVGVVPTRRLLMSPLEARLEDLMLRQVISVPASASLLLACELLVMHRLLALPVVDELGRLVGQVDVQLFTDQMFDVSERHSAEDTFQLIGVRLAQLRRLSPWSGFRQRFPWLLCNVAGGTLCALVAGLYEPFLGSVIVLALFIPVVLAVAESVSMQSMTLTLQALHAQRPGWRFLWRSLVSELLTATLLGCGTGALVGLVAWAWKGTGAVAAAIAATLLLAVVTACLLGVLLPVAVRAFRGDPRIAAGPIVLACADVATLMLYFNIAGLLLSRA